MIYSIAMAWINLFEAVVGVLTFGRWYPLWTSRFAKWHTLRKIKR